MSPNRTKTPPRRRALPLVGLAALAFLLTSCTGPAVASLYITPGSHYIVTDSADGTCDDVEMPYADAEATLVGAYFALKVDCVGEADSFDELEMDSDSEDWGDLYPLPPGDSLVYLRFADPNPHRPLYQQSNPENVTSTITIGEQDWTLENEVPQPGDTFVWVGDASTEIRIEINDNNHVFAMDPRTGEREGVIDALYHGSLLSKQSDRYPIDAEFEGSSGSYVYSGSVRVFFQAFVERTVFRQEDGWVADGDTVELAVSYSWFETNDEWELEWNLDDDEAVEVSQDGEALEPAEVDAETVTEGGAQVREVTQYFEVDAEALEYSFTFTPPQEAVWAAEGVDMPLTKGNDEISFDISFT
ncbi:hypothetical protein [Haloglycomyces albus]|uniref:hypothetical protein n=1 Tax=Haloglycomyces albus TaxID=526067 RepID=UPI00046D0768|nr:hypothetical protein [Haloglycomyces albus]